MELKTFITIETDNGMTIKVEVDPLLDDNNFKVDNSIDLPF